jgi:hypothetical protein
LDDEIIGDLTKEDLVKFGFVTGDAIRFLKYIVSLSAAPIGGAAAASQSPSVIGRAVPSPVGEGYEDAAQSGAIPSPRVPDPHARLFQDAIGGHLFSDVQSSFESPHDNCKILWGILIELGIPGVMRDFQRNGVHDEALSPLSAFPPSMLQSSYNIPDHLVASFIQKCRIASHPVDPGHERWLKACLILRACAKAVRPFVGAVMTRLHQRVVNEVKDKIREYKTECSDSDWNCEFLPEDKASKFDERPLELDVDSLQADGSATTTQPHRLTDTEPFLFSKHNTRSIFENDEDHHFGLLNLCMQSLSDSNSKVESEKRFLMSIIFKSDKPCLEPFKVQVCRENGKSTVSYAAVFCQCKVGEAPRLVNALATKAAAAYPVRLGDNLQSSFWTIQLKSPGKYKPHEHSLKSEDVISFSGKCLPEGIFAGINYRVWNPSLSCQSFDIHSILIPAKPFDHASMPRNAVPRIRILRPAFPVGLFRDAAYRYHTKGANSELSKRWEGVNVRQISTKCCEFAKLFCSKTKKKLTDYFAPHEERSPELFYNMIIFCKAFHSSEAQPLDGFGSFFCSEGADDTRTLDSALDGIQRAAAVLTDCRNTVCHGDLYSLDEVSFKRIRDSSSEMLTLIQHVASALQGADFSEQFKRISEVALSQYQEIFEDDYKKCHICILHRHVALTSLTSEERNHFKVMIQGYQQEISDLKDQVSSIKKRQFDKLPVCTMQAIEQQILGQVDAKRGREGVVYNVEIWGDPLAAKIFHPGTDPKWRSELNSLTMLLHRNIVQVKYVIFDDRQKKHTKDPVGYAMERMDCSLFDYSKQTVLSLKHLLSLMKQVAVAVAYTHANKVAHLDIKPENILLDETKTLAKLCDFGCAYFLQSSIRSSMTPRGTPFFMAPEVNPDDVKLCDPFRVDVYAFGVSLFYLMKPDANCEQLMACDWGLLPDIPTELRKLGQSCTLKNPEDRPVMQEVRSKLEQIVDALWTVERLFKSAGIVPAEDHAIFARLLNAHTLIQDKEALLKLFPENPGLLSTIGMNFDQQNCLMRYLGCGSARVKPAAENTHSANTSE